MPKLVPSKQATDKSVQVMRDGAGEKIWCLQNIHEEILLWVG